MKDRYLPKEICDHLCIPDIQYFEDGKRSTLFVPDKNLIRHDADSFFHKLKVGLKLSEELSQHSPQKTKTRARKGITASTDNDDGNWVSLTELKRRKREKNKKEKEEKKMAKFKEDNYLPFV